MITFPPGTGGFLNPREIVESLEIIKEGMVIADFGCGHGYFTIPLAKKVGEEGKVYALDVLPKALEAVKSRLKLENIQNVVPIRCNLEKENGSTLEDELCDIVWIANLLFQTEDDRAVVREAKRVLKKDGYIVFIEWRVDVPFGPKGKRVAPEEAKKLFEEEGFLFEKTFSTDDYHYGMIFKKV